MSFLIEAVTRRCSMKKVFLNLAKFSEKYLCQSLLFNKVESLRLQHRSFPVNIATSLRKVFFIESLRWLLLAHMALRKLQHYLKTNQIHVFFHKQHFYNPGNYWQKIKQFLSNTLRLNFCCLEIIHILHPRSQ